MKNKVDEGFVAASSENLPEVDLDMMLDFISKSDYFRSSEMKNVKTERSMRSNYGDVAIGYVQLKRDAGVCTLRAQICPEHRTNAKNYNVHILINEKDQCIDEAECHDCAASEGGCKHAVAVLAWVYRKSEEPAPTSVACYWKKPALSKVSSTNKYLSIKNMLAGGKSDDPDKSKKNEEPPNQDFLRRIHHDERARKTNSHLFRFFYKSIIQQLSLHYLSGVFSGDRSNPAEFFLFCRSILTPENCNHAEKMTVKQSNSVSWFQLRYARITASIIYDAAMCHTLDGSLVERILSTMDYDTPAMKRGRELESKVLDSAGKLLMEKFNESSVKKCGLLLKKEYPALGASPDGITDNAVVEIKCPSKEKTKKNYYDEKQIKNKYKAQLHLQMLFAGKSTGYLCIADPKFETSRKIIVIKENFDRNFTTAVITKAMHFWEKAVFPHLMKE